MSEDKQTVAATEAPAQPGVEGVTAARTETVDLDKLLAEFGGSEPTEADTKPAPTERKGTDAIHETVDPVARDYIIRQDIERAIKTVRGDLDAEFFDDSFVEAWMDAQARQDPRLKQAWLSRHANPRQFQKVVETLGREFAKKYGKLPDKGATEDREAVTAAVRGASQKAPENKQPDLSRLTDAEFAELKARMFG